MQDSTVIIDTKEEAEEALPFLRVNAILPGFISSPMSDAVPQSTFGKKSL